MILDINPTHINGHNCLEDLLASFASWKKREYKLMYANSWDFDYIPISNGNNDRFGNRIFEAGDHCWGALEEYHGIKIEFMDDLTGKERLEYILNELDSNNPTIINIDAYYIPWSKTYLKSYMNHFIMAVGVDQEDESIKCIDPFLARGIQSIKINDFEISNGRCRKLSIADNDMENINWKEIVRTAVLWPAREKESGLNCFKAIRSFAADIGDQLDILNEIEGFDSEAITPIFIKLYFVGSSRYKVSKSLSYVGNKYNIEELVLLSKKLEELMWKWYEVRSILIKAGRAPASDIFELRSTVSSKLMQIADEEEALSGEFLRICD